jgi:DNA polymerase-4
MAARCIVCVLLDFFIVAVELQDHPRLRGTPVIVGGDPKKRGLVVAASAEAMAFGVTPGMPSWEALHRCPQATLLDAHPDLYQNKSHMVLNILGLYSDQIEHSRLDCFYLIVPGLTTAAGAREVMTGLQQQLADQANLPASVGAASNKLVAYIAAGLHAPGGLVYVPPGEEASFLAPLSLEWLVTDGKMHSQLTKLGLRTIGDLARVPAAQLVAHIGQAGKVLLRHAQGKDARQLHPTQQREAVEWEHAFDRVMNDHDALRRWTVYLSGQVGQDLRSRAARARTLTLTLGHLDGSPTVVSAILPKATDLDHVLRDTALHLLGAWDGRAGVASLGLEAAVFNGEQGFQLQLFSEGSAKGDGHRREEEKREEERQQEQKQEERQHHLDHTKNGLNKRYGPGTVMAAMLLDDEILKAMGKRRRKK